MTPEPSTFTPAQEEVWRSVVAQLREHFDASVLVVESDIEHDDHATIKRGTYHGGMSQALGLLQREQQRLLDIDRQPEKEED